MLFLVKNQSETSVTPPAREGPVANALQEEHVEASCRKRCVLDPDPMSKIYFQTNTSGRLFLSAETSTPVLAINSWHQNKVASTQLVHGKTAPAACPQSTAMLLALHDVENLHLLSCHCRLRRARPPLASSKTRCCFKAPQCARKTSSNG